MEIWQICMDGNTADLLDRNMADFYGWKYDRFVWIEIWQICIDGNMADLYGWKYDRFVLMEILHVGNNNNNNNNNNMCVYACVCVFVCEIWQICKDGNMAYLYG